MKAVVMAGGFGTRIQPLTHSIPKPMLPVCNRPMMEYIIRALAGAGIGDIVVLLYFKPEVIRDYFGDGSAFGVNIEYVLPDDDYGTAGAVRYAGEFLKETFMVVSGDLVTDFNFGEIIEFHRRKEAKVTITLTSTENPLQFGVVITDRESRIVRFLEKPAWDEVISDTINTGIYVMEPEVLNYIPYRKSFDFSKDLFPLMLKKGERMFGCEVDGYWRDVGNPKSYREVHADILDGKVNLIEFKEKGTGFELLADDDSYKRFSCSFGGRVVIGRNVSIGDSVGIKNCVIGNNVKIGDGVTLDGCVLWDNVSIGSQSYLKEAVVCNDTHIGRSVRAPHGVIIAEGCEIEDFVSFEKDVTVWPNKIIEEASLVNSSIVWGDRYRNSIFENGRITGRTNAELSCEMSLKIAEAFATTLPVGSYVIMSRDYKSSSRMLKRVFHGGLLSSGINVIDLHILPSVVTQYVIRFHKNVVAGFHFRQSPSNPLESNILFFTGDGIPISPSAEKSAERIFFRENFRRVDPYKIGKTLEALDSEEIYVDNFIKSLDGSVFKDRKTRIAADLMFSSVSDIYPRILNTIGIENIVINAYRDDKKLSDIALHEKKSFRELSTIITSLGLDLGYMIFPSGRRLKVINDRGSVLEDYNALMVFLWLINRERKIDRVFLSFESPDFCDEYFDRIRIERGKLRDLDINEMKKYGFIANSAGNYAFCEFSYSMDALYSSLRMLKMLKMLNLTLSELTHRIPSFFYRMKKIGVPSHKKGKIMRLFVESVHDMKVSHLDGVKVWISDREWVLLKPEAHDEFMNLIVQSKDRDSGMRLLDEYTQKIKEWLEE